MSGTVTRGTWLGVVVISLVGLVPANCQSPVQAGRFTIRIGGHVGAVAVNDLNKDGKPDILASNIDSGSLSVHLGDGQGGFQEAERSPFPAGNNPEDLAVGDFNGDGRLDVAVANHATDYVTVLLGDGKGGFAAAPGSPVNVPSRPHPHGVTAGDFNGDGRLDLALESRDESVVLVLYGNGEGEFLGGAKRFAVGRWPYWKLRAGDLNHDGRADIVTTNVEGSSVSVLLADGVGGFQAAKNIPTAKAPFAVAIGDVNGDGRADLAVAHRRGGPETDLDGLTILLGDGTGGFSAIPESPLKAGESPTAVAVGDYDGDGFGDLVVANMGSHDVTVFLGGRSGLREAEASPIPVGEGPSAVAIADLNADGKADILTGNWGSGDVSAVLSP